jgi:hypothetical protein
VSEARLCSGLIEVWTVTMIHTSSGRAVRRLLLDEEGTIVTIGYHLKISFFG